MSLEYFNLIQNGHYSSLIKKMRARDFDCNAFNSDGHTLLHAAVLSESANPSRLIFIEKLLKIPNLTRANDRSPRTYLTAYATAVHRLDFLAIEAFEKSARKELDLIYSGRMFDEKELILEELLHLADRPSSASLASAVIALKEKVEERSLTHAIRMDNVILLKRLAALYEGDNFFIKHESFIRHMLLDHPECIEVKAFFPKSHESSPHALPLDTSPILASPTWIPRFFSQKDLAEDILERSLEKVL